MMFWMMTIMATKQQQARRYAELYGYSRYGGMYGGGGLGIGGHPGLGWRGSRYADDFWDEFESGRRGGGHGYGLGTDTLRSNDAFFKLQILQMLLAQRGVGDEDEDEDEYYDDEDEEEDYAGGEATTRDEELELLSAHAAFYEEERRCGSSAGFRG
jgi:hypothetical protein